MTLNRFGMTAAQYAAFQGLTVGAARYQLEKMVSAGTATRMAWYEPAKVPRIPPHKVVHYFPKAAP
jgi:hypothetical protein